MGCIIESMAVPAATARRRRPRLTASQERRFKKKKIFENHKRSKQAVLLGTF